MLRNIAAKLKFLQVLANQSITADTNTTGVDCEAFGSMGFLVSVGAFAFDGSNKIDLKMQYSDDNVTFVDVPESEMYSVDGAAPIAKSLKAAGDASKVHFLEYRGAKRYARLALDVTGTVSVGVSVATVGGHSELMPPL